MPRLVRDPSRQNFTLEQRGKEYQQRLLFRAQSIFTTILNLLPSNYTSSVQGPNYTLEVKSVAVELAKLELALEDVNDDRALNTTRPEFLYSIIGYLLLLNGRFPAVQFDDEQFRQFLTSLIRIYFQGSIPESIEDAVGLFVAGDIKVTENFLLVRKGASGYDISDQFGFQIDIGSGTGFPSNIFDIDSSLRMILDIIRPAHTLFTIRYIFDDTYVPNPEDTIGRIIDAYRWSLNSYYYDDFRSNWEGLRDRDRLGMKTNQTVVGEDHSVWPFGVGPTIADISPDGLSLGALTPLTISGHRFVAGATVTINGIACTSVVVVNSSTITCISPSISFPGQGIIVVTNPDLQSASFPILFYMGDNSDITESNLVTIS